ncbi:MAG: hypothetical protein WCD53_13500 [Microcoleus sp.]
MVRKQGTVNSQQRTAHQFIQQAIASLITRRSHLASADVECGWN